MKYLEKHPTVTCICLVSEKNINDIQHYMYISNVRYNTTCVRYCTTCVCHVFDDHERHTSHVQACMYSSVRKNPTLVLFQIKLFFVRGNKTFKL